MNRRGFLRGLAALAAVAVAPSLPATQVETEHARLLRMMQSGRIEGETFYLDGPIVIGGVSNLLITGCTFMFSGLKATDTALTIRNDCTELAVTHNRFEWKGTIACAIRIESPDSFPDQCLFVSPPA